MPNIRSSADLRNNYNDISSYCHAYNEPVFITKNGKTAPCVLREIREKIERLSTTPNMCEEYKHDPSYRELVADKCLVFYRVQEAQQNVEIHRVLRGAWNLPRYLE